MGRFLEELPGDKFTIVLKKVTGHEAVPLFQTLTFHVEQAHLDGDFNIVQMHSSMLTAEGLVSLFETQSVVDFLEERQLDTLTAAWYALFSVVMTTVLFVAFYRCRKSSQQNEKMSPEISIGSVSNESQISKKEGNRDFIQVTDQENKAQYGSNANYERLAPKAQQAPQPAVSF